MHACADDGQAELFFDEAEALAGLSDDQRAAVLAARAQDALHMGQDGEEGEHELLEVSLAAQVHMQHALCAQWWRASPRVTHNPCKYMFCHHCTPGLMKNITMCF